MIQLPLLPIPSKGETDGLTWCDLTETGLKKKNNKKSQHLLRPASFSPPRHQEFAVQPVKANPVTIQEMETNYFELDPETLKAKAARHRAAQSLWSSGEQAHCCSISWSLPTVFRCSLQWRTCIVVIHWNFYPSGQERSGPQQGAPQ